MSIDAYKVGRYGLTSPGESLESILVDPRGMLLVNEEPQRNASYIIGVDPTVGISGWNRALRTKDDFRIDNAAIEVFRIGLPNVQVAEYAAPIDAESLAPICNMLGRLYCGNHEEGQALMCIEVYPGPGWMTQRELISRFGYYHLPPWLVEGGGLTQRMTHKYGWISSRNTRSDLWTRGANHLNRKLVRMFSQWLAEEMADCTPDSFLSVTARSRGNGIHDDRVLAMMIALWFANEWTLNLEPTERTDVEEATPKNYQAMGTDEDGLPMTASRMAEQWSDLADRLLDD
jgi:hypothetical protein